MTTEKKSPPSDGERMGIIQPAFRYRFRVLFGEHTTNSALASLTQQVMNFKIDMKNKTATVQIRQPVTLGVFNAVKHLTKHSHSLYVERLNGANTETHSTIHFSGCECSEHSFDFDYKCEKEDFVAVHDLVFTYADIHEEEPIDWSAHKE